jgi:hypothetical protein
MLVAQVCRRDEANPKSLSRSRILRSFAGGRTHKQWSHQQRPRRSKAIWVPLLLHQRLKNCVNAVLVKFDADFGPKVVGQII